MHLFDCLSPTCVVVSYDDDDDDDDDLHIFYIYCCASPACVAFDGNLFGPIVTA